MFEPARNNAVGANLNITQDPAVPEISAAKNPGPLPGIATLARPFKKLQAFSWGLHCVDLVDKRVIWPRLCTEIQSGQAMPRMGCARGMIMRPTPDSKPCGRAWYDWMAGVGLGFDEASLRPGGFRWVIGMGRTVFQFEQDANQSATLERRKRVLGCVGILLVLLAVLGPFLFSSEDVPLVVLLMIMAACPGVASGVVGGRRNSMGITLLGPAVVISLWVGFFVKSSPSVGRALSDLWQEPGLLILGSLASCGSALLMSAICMPVKRAKNRCGACGYLLIGLVEPRCPECGTVFDPAEAGMGGGGEGDEVKREAVSDEAVKDEAVSEV